MIKQFSRFRPSVLTLIYAAAVCLLGLGLASCADRDRSREDIQVTADKAIEGLEAIKPSRIPNSSLIEETSPWFGNTTIAAQSGDILPEQLEKDNALVLTFEGPVTLEQLAIRIQAATGLRVTVVGSAGMGGGAASGGAMGGTSAGGAGGSGTFLPADGLEVTGGRTVWQGKLSNLLDQVADRFDAEWKYSDNAIQISEQVVRTFMLHALAGSTDVGGSVKTGTTGAEGGLPQQSVDSTSKLVVWEEIQKTIDTIINGKARASYSPATGTITVAGSPSSVKAVETYLRMQNKLRLRRVSLEAKVLSVQLSKEYDNNFDLDVVVKDAIGNSPFIYSSAAATGLDVGRTVQAGIVRDSQIPTGGLNGPNPRDGGVRAVINALSAVARRVTTEYSGTLVTLSDQPAPLQVATKRAYVARVSGSATDGASATTLEPGTIDIGLSMNLLPRIIEQDRVMLRIALGITDLVQLREFSSGTSSLQLPEVDTTGFLQNAVLQSGETLVLAGFERKSANDIQTGTGNPSNWLLGGGEEYGHGREIRVLMITAKVLPEDPVNVIAP